MKNLKITPLTIVIAICITYAMYLLAGIETQSETINSYLKAFYTLILAIVLFLTDMLFRKFIEDRKWLWLIQGSFIILIILMIIIFQKTGS